MLRLNRDGIIDEQSVRVTSEDGEEMHLELGTEYSPSDGWSDYLIQSNAGSGFMSYVLWGSALNNFTFDDKVSYNMMNDSLISF